MWKKRFSIKMIIGSILAGFIYGLAGELIYKNMELPVPHIIVVMLYFTGMFLFIGIAVYFIGKSGNYQSYTQVNKKQWLAAFVLMIFLSLLFEFLYSNISLKAKGQDFSSYLFVVDNSGSMDNTDPDGIRYQAIDKLLGNKDSKFEYAIYKFSDSTELAREMSPIDNSIKEQEIVNAGGTQIANALRTVLEDIQSGKMVLGNDSRVILLSDGQATDVDSSNMDEYNKMLEQFKEQDITISTVGMTHKADTSLLMHTAESTGGMFVSVDNVEQLEQEMKQMVEETEEDRSLLKASTEDNINWLFVVLRVLFIICLGIIIAVEKAILCERFLNTNTVLSSSVAGSVMAGIFMEAGMDFFCLPPGIVRITVCVLVAFTLLHEDMASSA